MPNTVTFQGNPLTLVGRHLAIGSQAPDFKVVSPELKEVSLLDFTGKIKVITTFPSIDTPVCDFQVKEFNKQAASFSPEVVVLGISKDLPFAQKRFCQANEIKNVMTLSDYKTSSFGLNYGLLVKELNLLARSVLILDKKNTLRYFRIVPELTRPPDYKEALKSLQVVVADPSMSPSETTPVSCKPCEAGALPLSKEKIRELIAGLAGWEVLEDKKMAKVFKFNDFPEAKYALDTIALIAQEQGHHPVMTLGYNTLKATLTTHAAGGLTDNDFIMAKAIDAITA